MSYKGIPIVAFISLSFHKEGMIIFPLVNKSQEWHSLISTLHGNGEFLQVRILSEWMPDKASV